MKLLSSITVMLLFISITAFGQQTANYITKFTTPPTIGNSLVYDNGTNVGIGLATPADKLHVLGNISIGNNSPSQIYFRYGGVGTGGDVTGMQNGTQMMSFGFHNEGIFSGSPGAASGRTIYFYDRVLSSFRGGIDALGTWWFGSSATNYGLRVDAQNAARTAMTITSTGNVGIGMSNPVSKLEIKDGSVHYGFGICSNITSDYYLMFDYSTTNNYGIIQPRQAGVLYTNLVLNSSGGNVGIGTTTPLAKLDVNGNIFSNAKIVIGTTDMTKVGAYSLAVNGDAIFNKAVVKKFPNWPDYVFENNYKLMPLQDLQKFVQENKHLPNVPSASEVEKEGIDLGDMHSRLLRKVEELTLYMIEQNKKMEEQAAEINTLKTQLSLLQKQN
ncbi:MAG: hypothetical protein ABIN97_09210 [Ginsengibacter sp.]